MNDIAKQLEEHDEQVTAPTKVYVLSGRRNDEDRFIIGAYTSFDLANDERKNRFDSELDLSIDTCTLNLSIYDK